MSYSFQKVALNVSMAVPIAALCASAAPAAYIETQKVRRLDGKNADPSFHTENHFRAREEEGKEGPFQNRGHPREEERVGRARVFCSPVSCGPFRWRWRARSKKSREGIWPVSSPISWMYAGPSSQWCLFYNLRF